MGGKTSTSTQGVSIPPAVLAQYQSVVSSANQTAQKPFQSYTGSGTPISGTGYTTDTAGNFVAGLSPEQQAGVGATNTYAQAAQPYYSAAASGLTSAQNATNPANAAALGLAGASAEQVNAQQIGPEQISQFENPYLGQVLGSTSALLNQNNQQQQSGALGTAIQSGAFGGDRTGLAAANLEQQQNLANANIYSGIASNAFNTALGAAQQQQGVNLSAGQANRAALGAAGQEIAGIGSTAYGEGANTASELGALGSGAQAAGLSGAQAQIGAGTLQQQTQQAQDTAQYNQFLQQQSFPYQVGSWLAGISEGTGALSGSTTTTTQPGGFFSDRRLKHDIKKIGKTYDGQHIYSYKMHGDARTHIGLMAQEVEKKHPESVGLARGYKIVDYGSATEAAANRGHFYAGGVVPIRKGLSIGGQPYSPQVSAGTTTTTSPVAQGRSALVSGLASGASPTPGTAGMGGLVGMANGTGAAPARMPFADGGYSGPYGDMSSILATQENMYQPNQTKNRNIPAQTQNHQLAVASGSPPPRPSGASNVQTSIGLGKDVYQLGNKGYNMYQNHQLDSVSNYNPTASGFDPDSIPTNLPAPTFDAQPTGLSGASSPVAAPSSGLASGADAGAASASAPTAGLAAGDAAASAAPVAADAAGTAAAGAGADAAAGAAAGAAGGAAAEGGADAAAALAADYLAADAAVAAIAAKRGGKIERAGLDAGGVPYESDVSGQPYSGDMGQIDIPDTANTSKLQTAGPLKKQPTGLQTLMTLGTEQGATNALGGMFSNQALAGGGRIHKDDGGDVDGTTLPDIEVDGTRPDDSDLTPAMVTPHEKLGLAAANDDVPPPVEQPKKSALGAVGDFWAKHKTDIIPALEGLAAMGTAPTRHLGVALAAGLGAGAQSYFPTQAQSIQNQQAQFNLDLMKGAFKPQPVTSSGPPSGSAPVAPVVADADPATQAKLSAYYHQRLDVPPITQQEAAQKEALQRSGGYLKNPGLAASMDTAIQARQQNATFANQKWAQQQHDQNYDVATAPGGNFAALQQIDPVAAGRIAQRLKFDPSTGQIPPQADDAAKIVATMKVNTILPWTGDTISNENGINRNSRTKAPAIGSQATVLSPQQYQAAYASGIDEANQPVTLGNGLPGFRWQQTRASSPDAYARSRIPGSAGSQGVPVPSPSPSAQRGAANTLARRPATPKSPAARNATATAPTAQPDMLPGVDISSIPKLPGPPPVVDQTSKEKANLVNAANVKIQNDALGSYNEQVRAAARNTALYTQLDEKLAKADPKAFGPTSEYYKAYQGLVTALRGGNSPAGLVNQAEVDKYLTMLGVGGSRQLLGSDNPLRQQELLTLMQHANPNMDQPLRAIKALVAYGKANNEFDLKGGNTAIAAITAGANPRSVSGIIDAQRSNYITNSLTTAARTPVRTGMYNGKKVTQYSDGTIE